MRAWIYRYLWIVTFLRVFFYPIVHAQSPDPSGIVSLIGAQSFAKGCPISEDRLLTSRHVAVEDIPGQPSRPKYFAWSDQADHYGVVWPVDYDLFRDLALMQSDHPFATWYPQATVAPAIGSEVVIAGYRVNGRFELKTIKTKVLNIVAWHLVLDKAGEPGFSGSCVLNGTNDVVGIYQWAVTQGGTTRGMASAVFGPWGTVGWLPPTQGGQ